MTTYLDPKLASWLATHANSLDQTSLHADALLPLLAANGLFRVGVPESEGGSGGTMSAAVAVAADLAEHSLAVAFVFWAQRASIECLLNSPNRPLVKQLLPALLDGILAGAPGLSNAMKFLGGLDRLHLRFTEGPQGRVLNGVVAWATNLRKQGFVVAAAIQNEHDGSAPVFAIPGQAGGVVRTADVDLKGLRGTNTAALRLTDVALDDSWCLHPEARTFLPKIRPALLALQCGLGLGLARASLAAVRGLGAEMPPVLQAEFALLQQSISEYWLEFSSGIDERRLEERPRDLVRLRLRMVELATSAVQLELQALGGKGYVRDGADGFTRRSREAEFLPVVTPTVLQLKTELSKLEAQR